MREGLTLIELMIIVTIIGILTAIALPIYGDYMACAQTIGGYELLGGLKTPLVEAVAANGSMAAYKGTTGTNDNQPWFQLVVTTGKRVDNVAAVVDGSNYGLTATSEAASTGASDRVADHKAVMTLSPSDGKWACRFDLDKNISPAVYRDAT